MDEETVDLRVEAHRRGRKNKNEPYQPSGSPYHLPSTSGGLLPLNKLVFGAGYKAVYDRIHRNQKESNRPQKGNCHGSYNEIDKISKYRDKNFADQIFLARKFVHEAGMRSNRNSLSGERRDLLGFFQKQDSCITRRSKSSSCPQSNGVTIRSILAAKIAEHEGFSERKRSKLASENGKSRSTDRIVVLKPAEPVTSRSSVTSSRNSSDTIFVLKPVGIVSEQIICDCSSKTLQGRRIQDTKVSSPFAFKNMKKKLKHAFIETAKEFLSGNGSSDRESKSCSSSVVPVMDSCTKREHVSRKDLNTNQAMCKETSLSGIDKLELDTVMEAKWQLSLGWSNRQSKQAFQDKQAPKTLPGFLSSPESTVSPKTVRHYCTFGFDMIQYSPKNISGRIINSHTEKRIQREIVSACTIGTRTDTSSTKDHNKCNKIEKRTKASHQDRTPDELMHNNDSNMSEFRLPMKSNNLSRIMQPETMESQKDCASHSILDSHSENKESTSTIHDISSTSSGIYQLRLAGGIKHCKEYQSPVSVLEPFVAKKCFTSPGISHYKGEKKLLPLHLEFDDCLSDPAPEKETRSKYIQVEHKHLSHYVHRVLEASCLNWNSLSAFEFPPQKLLQESLFDEVDSPSGHRYFDPKLLFDHINEVLMEIFHSHFNSALIPKFLKPKFKITSLAGDVIDQIIAQADFYLHPRTKKGNLGHLVSEDVKRCRSWFDTQLDTEIIVNTISEDVLTEFVLDMLLEFLD